MPLSSYVFLCLIPLSSFLVHYLLFKSVFFIMLRVPSPCPFSPYSLLLPLFVLAFSRFRLGVYMSWCLSFIVGVLCSSVAVFFFVVVY